MLNSKKNCSSGVMNLSYAQGREQKPEFIYRYKIRALTAILQAPELFQKKILDLGCADGLTLKEISSRCNPEEALGVEYSKTLALKAQQNGVNVITGDVESLPEEIPSNHYNVVTALALLEHLKNPLNCFKEVKKVLAPGGLFIATAPNPFWDNLAAFTRIHKEQEFHENSFNKKLFKQLCEESGLIFKNYDPFMFVFTAILPYIGISPDLNLSLKIDKIVKNSFFNPLFINQIFIAQKI
jgi:2-polyprenyl-3-methyl-5-hydroxy-6-metoxy-1,4-benzoquinol methylase